ncbi:MAG: FAD-dependent 5-carboxymethylaminomethyl-2-thiouridine(34) oxidoreductase MnmC [Myxococcota bacterium]|nr:FAD-dependent 5-carboxymethylaminomethyl-2-thiouridine(34) oxidoreductase MnmC [Myxococcota bacterium]
MNVLRVAELGGHREVQPLQIKGDTHLAVSSIEALAMAMDRLLHDAQEYFILCWTPCPRRIAADERPDSASWSFLVRHQPPLIQGWYSLRHRNVAILICYSERPPFFSSRLQWLDTNSPAKGKRLPSYFSAAPRSDATVLDVVGAGIVGCVTANYFARRGFRVRMWDAADRIMSGASGNPHAVLFSQLSPFDQIQPRFYLSSLYAAIQSLEEMQREYPEIGFFSQCGVFTRSSHGEMWERVLHDRVSTNFMQATQRGLLLPKAGVLDPMTLGRLLTSHPAIELSLNTPISNIRVSNTRTYLQTKRGEISTMLVVLCNAYAVKDFSLCNGLALKKSVGQLSYTLKKRYENDRVLSAEAYVTPYWNGFQCLGATYRQKESSLDVLESENQENIQRVAQAFPLLEGAADAQMYGRVGIRAQSNNFLPIIGPIPDVQFYRTHYQRLRHGMLSSPQYPDARYVPGLFVNTGHGSKGFSQAWIAAQLLYAQIRNLPPPVDWQLYQSLHPARFTVKRLRKGEAI